MCACICTCSIVISVWYECVMGGVGFVAQRLQSETGGVKYSSGSGCSGHPISFV